MVNQELVGYVHQQLAAGVSREQISINLLGQNWSKQDIDEAFAATSPAPTPVSTKPITPGPASAPLQPIQSVQQSQPLDDLVAPRTSSIKTHAILGTSAVAIGVLFYFGMRVFVPSRVSIVKILTSEAGEFAEYVVLLLPIIGVVALLVLCGWLWGRRIRKKEGRPVLAFFFGTAVYLLLVFVAYGVVYALSSNLIRGVAPDVSFVVVLSLSILFVVIVQIAYAGLLVCMGLLLLSSRSSYPLVPLERKKFTLHARYAAIGAACALSLYAFGVFAPVAIVTNQQWLCNAVYQSRKKAACYLETSATASSEQEAAQDSSGSGTFTIVKTDYKQIKNLMEVGGKLAYAYENEDRTSGVVYDGQVVSGAYQKVGILPIAEVSGKLAYEAYKGDKQIIVWDGREYGEQYDMALRPIDVGGKLAYLAQIGSERPNIKQIVVWDGKEYGADFNQTNNINDVGGQLAYTGKNTSGEYIVVGDKRYGPYAWVRWMKEEDGHVLALVDTAAGSQYFLDNTVTTLVHGNNDITSLHAILGGKLAYGVSKSDGKFSIIYDGKEIGESASYESGPFNIGGKLAYIAVNEDGTSQLVVDAQRVGPKFSGALGNIDVSPGGRVAVQIEHENKESTIYLDGEEVYKGMSGNPFGFFGEKLLFWVQDNKLSALWYDGKKIGQGFYGYNYFALVDGKLAIAAFASSGDKVQYSLLLEE